MASTPKEPSSETGSPGFSRVCSLCGVVLLAGLITLAACGTAFLSARDRDIANSTQAIGTARDDAQRAKAFSSRGTAYSEKARYGRIMKVIPNDEYERWFALAIKDHNQALALDPASAEVYFNRAQTYYDRGALDLVESTMRPANGTPPKNSDSTKAWFDAAATDFEKAAEIDAKNSRAFDMLGLTYESNGDQDKAVQAYTRELALDRHLGRLRLADAYCNIGYRHDLQKDFAAAATAYLKSIEFGRADDKTCPVEPFAQLIAIYTTETPLYEKAWEIVHEAQKAGRRIAPELIERLKKDSGRAD